MKEKEQETFFFTKYILDLVAFGGLSDETYEINKMFALMDVDGKIELLTNLKKEMFSRSKNILNEEIKKLQTIKKEIERMNKYIFPLLK